MRFLNNNDTKKYTIIIGCGRLGANLANTLSDQGGNILIIDKDKDSFRKLSPSFGGLTLEGDASDYDILQDANIDKANVILVVTNNDNINVMIAQIAREIFNVERVIARLYDPERECIYSELDIGTICPAILSAIEVDKILSKAVSIKSSNLDSIYREELI